MSWEERFGLVVTLVMIIGMGLLIVATAGPGDAKAIANCTIPTGGPSTSFPSEEQTFDDSSHDAISKAEHFVCHQILYPSSSRGWKLQGIDAFRLRFGNDSSWRVHLRFTLGTYGTESAHYLLLVIHQADERVPDITTIGPGTNAPGERIWLGSQPAELVRPNNNPYNFLISWNHSGFRFEAMLPDGGSPDVTLDELISFLRSTK